MPPYFLRPGPQIVTEQVSVVVLGHPIYGDLLHQPWQTNIIPYKVPSNPNFSDVLRRQGLF